MAKGNAVLKIAGILFILFGILGILFAMMYGFVGALGFKEMGKTILTGLLIFYGLYGVFTGFFQIAAGAIAIRQSNQPEHWLRCLVWGMVLLVIGLICNVLLRVSSGMIHKASDFYPPWFGIAAVMVGGLALPLLMILGGLLNRSSKDRITAAAVQAADRAEPAAETSSPKEIPVTETAENVLKDAAMPAPELQQPEPLKTGGAVIPKQGGRLEYLQNRRLTRQTGLRAAKKFHKDG